MAKCCILMCGARKNKKQPELTLHRFPKNEVLRKRWLEAIGERKIDPGQKEWLVCSLHFEKSCFNKTLDVIRLRDNSLPSIFPYQVSYIKFISVHFVDIYYVHKSYSRKIEYS